MDKRTVAYGQVWVRKDNNEHWVIQSAGPKGIKLRAGFKPHKETLIRWVAFERQFEPVADWFRRQTAERGGAA